ncbi:MAG: CysS/YqeB C-terminal domain-containing protein [Acidimicrobiales bacterium]
MNLPRLLVIMGSGETSPTMVKTHREVFARLDAALEDPAGGALLDTPYGFQENADDISARAVDYFRRSVGRHVGVAGFRRGGGVDPLAQETALACLRRAPWLFAGPGSPTYALRQWAGSEIPALLADKLRHGGAVTFASAAALTLGAVAVPVYEIYKVGADPAWTPGLDLLAPFGLPVAVIPHYDNAEGGNHDTRFCYLGERRLRVLEARLPEEAFVLGVDEHTGLVLDLDASTATVVGLGQVTLRRHGSSTTLPSGATVTIGHLSSMADKPQGKGPGPLCPPAAEGAGPPDPAPRATPLMQAVRDLEAAFDQALAAGDVDVAVRAALELDDAVAGWRADTLQSDEQERGRAALRRMIVRLGELARTGTRPLRDVIGPYVEQLLRLRDAARHDGRFSEADGIRDQLVALGLSVHDTPEETMWDPPA